MKWYDYTVIFLLADFMSASIIVGDLLTLAILTITYLSYEDFRRAK